MQISKICSIAFFTALGLYGCKKDTYVGKNPYADAREPLDIKIKTVTEVGQASAGALFHLSGEGFEAYKDSGMVVKFNGVPAMIEKVADTSIDVRVPEQASSGMVTLTINRQIFPGPQVRVKGAIFIDPDFVNMPGAEGAIGCVVPVSGGRWLLGGAFEDYGNSGAADGYNGLALIGPDGRLDKDFKVGKGFSGSVSALAVQADGRIVVGGNFRDYNERYKLNPIYIRNIVRLLPGGQLDTMAITTKTGTSLIVPTINAYFDGSVSKILQSPVDGKLTVLGNFNYFIRKDFTATTVDGLRDSVILDSVRMEGLVRLEEDGSFDSTYNYNIAERKSSAGLNGGVSNAILLSDGRVLLAGNFSRFHGKTTKGIVILDDKGEIDPSFNIGTGPNDQVTAASVLADGRIIVAGLFSSFNGVSARKVVMLNKTGSVVSGFSVGTGPSAGPDLSVNQILPLRNDKLLLVGNFENFSGISRKGMVVLEPDGTLAAGFNNMGAVVGNIKQMAAVSSTNSVLLVGDFKKFDLTAVGNIVQLRY